MAKVKVTITTTINGYSKKKGKGCFGIKVGDVKLSEGVRNHLDTWIDNAEKVKLTIETVQENLPTMEDA